MNKLHITLLSLTVGIAATLSAGVATTVARAEEPENGTVIKTLVDYFGNDVDLPVEYVNGTYYLADYTRNIYMHNGSTVRSEREMHETPNKFPIYSSTDGKFNDYMAVSMYANLIKAYDFYTEENTGYDWFGVNGKNDEIHNNASSRVGIELPLHAFVHMNAGIYQFNAAYSHQPYINHCIVFAGDGSEWNSTQNMQHQAAALDVLAHEYQHGVTDFFSNGLVYDGESGALNEAFSDMIGLIVEAKEKGYTPDQKEFWVMGEDAVSRYGNYLRNIINPDNGFRATYSDRFVCTFHANGYHDIYCDNNGVHYNSTILTHMQYLACQKLPGYFTCENLAKLWMRTLKTIPRDSNFDSFVKKYRAAAADLGFSQAAQTAILDALKECGFKDYFKVTFQNEDGTVLGTSFVAEGEAATAPQKPEKAHDDKYRYVFDGWEGDFKNITEDTVITAKYKPVEIRVLRFLDAEGNLFEEQVVDLGEKAKVPTKTPEKSAIPGKRFVFDKWDYDFGTVNESADISPIFKEINLYTVRFLNGDGSLIEEQEVDEGKAATAPKQTPVKATDDVGRYTFREWDTAFNEVKGNLDVKPLFDITHLYKIQFVDSDGNPLTEEYVLEEGQSVEAPDAPKKASDAQFNYTFKGWDGAYENVQQSAVIKPIYESETRKYSVVYYLNGKISNSEDYYADYGSPLKAAPKGYDGWYTDEECKVRFEETTITQHLKLYAKKKNTGLFIGLGIGGGVLILGAVAALVIVKAKKH